MAETFGSIIDYIANTYLPQAERPLVRGSVQLLRRSHVGPPSGGAVGSADLDPSTV